jgi:hypothetical protein
MNTTATPTAAPRQLRSSGSVPLGRSTHGNPAAPSATSSAEPARGAVMLFEVPFASAMRDDDLALLARVLDLSTRMHPKSRPNHDSPGLARLDHTSGLFLHRGSVEGQWMLEARTWGHPAPETIHQWHVLAAGAAHQLDPTVSLPDRLPVSTCAIPDRPLGRAQNKRLAQFRRRIVGLK